MSERQLHLARGLTLDPDYVGGGTFALLAKKGAGKTYTGRVIAEEMWKAQVPFVALDPMDAWWGLRSSADGEGEGIPVAIFGGPHGDAPLERTAGKLMADLVVDERLSMVLSLKHFGTRAAERQFAMEFLERLYRRNSELVHLFIDEADLFAPQKPQAGDQPLLGITENIVRRGRNNGIGVTLITQRPAVLNKDVLTQVDGLIVMRMLGPQDRNAIDAWVGEHGDTKLAKSIKDTLPGLPTGEGWVWVPELDVLDQVKVRRSRTFDSSPTRKRGAKAREPKSFADVDMEAIESKMAETIERAKRDDPKELRREIARLEKELRERPSEQIEVEKIVEIPVLANGALDSLRGVLETAEKITAAFSGAAGEITAELRRYTASTPATPQRAASKPKPSVSRRSAVPRSGRTHVDGDALGKAPRTMLEVLAQRHPMRVTRSQLCTLSGYKPRSSTVRNALSALRTQGLIEEARNELWISELGLDVVGETLPPQSPEQVIAHWRSVIGAAPRAFLDVLLDEYPDPVDREVACERTGYSPESSTVRNALSTLRRNGLLEDVGGGAIRASADLMLEAV